MSTTHASVPSPEGVEITAVQMHDVRVSEPGPVWQADRLATVAKAPRTGLSQQRLSEADFQ